MAKLIEVARTALFDDELASIEGIGPEKSAKFIGFFRDDKNFGKVQRLMKELDIREEEPQEKGSMCEGLTFVVTGDVHHYKNEQQGGKVTGSVSKSTSFLINNDAASASTKNRKAQQLGIPIITEDQFVEQFTKES